MTLAAQFRLLRWLGPWASSTAAPAGVARRSIVVDGAFEAWLYTPAARAPIGAYLVAPGLHYAGPADPRMDRFLRVLAASGLVVLCPFLPDYCALYVRETVIADFARAFDAMSALDEVPRGVRPGLFSVSFGSLPALRLAADERYAARVGAVVPFGGYADFRAVVEHSLAGGGAGRPHDPLNRPVVVMNLLDDMRGVPRERARVVDAWQRYVRATWGRPEMRAGERWREVARELGAGLHGDELAFYRMGVGLDDGALELCLDALERAGAKRAFLDPRPHLSSLRAPVHVFHGADDDVIPWEQLDALYAALPAHVEKARYLTGLYAHTGASALRSLPAMAREGVTLLRMLRALVNSATST